MTRAKWVFKDFKDRSDPSERQAPWVRQDPKEKGVPWDPQDRKVLVGTEEKSVELDPWVRPVLEASRVRGVHNIFVKILTDQLLTNCWYRGPISNCRRSDE